MKITRHKNTSVTIRAAAFEIDALTLLVREGAPWVDPLPERLLEGKDFNDQELIKLGVANVIAALSPADAAKEDRR